MGLERQVTFSFEGKTQKEIREYIQLVTEAYSSLGNDTTLPEAHREAGSYFKEAIKSAHAKGTKDSPNRTAAEVYSFIFSVFVKQKTNGAATITLQPKDKAVTFTVQQPPMDPKNSIELIDDDLSSQRELVLWDLHEIIGLLIKESGRNYSSYEIEQFSIALHRHEEKSYIGVEMVIDKGKEKKVYTHPREVKELMFERF